MAKKKGHRKGKYPSALKEINEMAKAYKAKHPGASQQSAVKHAAAKYRAK